jgi:hypothetical protein
VATRRIVSRGLGFLRRRRIAGSMRAIPLIPSAGQWGSWLGDLLSNDVNETMARFTMWRSRAGVVDALRDASISLRVVVSCVWMQLDGHRTGDSHWTKLGPLLSGI